MSITITPLGGFYEVGRNSVAVEYNGKIVILDMGFHLERFIELTEDDIPHKKHSLKKLVSQGALPDIRHLRRRRHDVVGILCSHAHLDHIGAIPFLGKYFSCPVYGTPFTVEVMRLLCEDRNVSLPFKTVQVGSTVEFDHGLKVEFIRVAHSTPQSTILALHTKEGTIIYGNDYKNDQTPPFEEPTDITRLGQLKGQVKLLMLECLYADEDDHCPSEQSVRDKLLSLDLKQHHSIISTTFSSNIARLITLCDVADTLGRHVVFLGRSLAKYIHAAQETHIYDFTKRGEVIKYSRKVTSFLRGLHSPEKYFIITTGHQGEPKAVLGRMANGLYKFWKDDVVIFSSRVIPTPLNQKNRRELEEKLKEVTILKDLHVSGHAAGKDHDELIKLLEPEYIAPSHGEKEMMEAMKKRGEALGYSDEKILFLKVGKSYKLQ